MGHLLYFNAIQRSRRHRSAVDLLLICESLWAQTPANPYSAFLLFDWLNTLLDSKPHNYFAVDCAKEASASKPDPAKAPENAHIANVIAGKANVSATAEDAEIAHLIDEMAEVPPAAGSGDVKHFTNRTEQPSRENKVCFATPLSGDVTVTFTATIPAALQPPPTATAVTASEICSVSVKSAKSPAAKSSVVHGKKPSSISQKAQSVLFRFGRRFSCDQPWTWTGKENAQCWFRLRKVVR